VNPTAPAGKVCVYVAGGDNANDVNGYSIRPGTGASPYGFKVAGGGRHISAPRITSPSCQHPLMSLVVTLVVAASALVGGGALPSVR
jgi:hypothetical protein